MGFEHKSVLLNETIEGLNIKPDGIYVDGTLGGGGHAYEVCRRLGEKGSIIGIDQDEAAIEAASVRLKDFGEKVTIIRSNYCDMKSKLHELGIDKVDGIVLDLGVSSYQLDTAERGFSYREDAPLDMRMDRRQKMTARDIVNDYSEMDLYRVIRDYGEDKFAKNIAKHIVIERAKEPIKTTGRFAEIISQAIPMKVRKQGGHPAKRTFQAIGIEVNQELSVLQNTLEEMIDLLNPGGRLCIITFHSLEDRIVKQAFKKAQDPCTCPPNFPVCVCGNRSKGHMVGRKPIMFLFTFTMFFSGGMIPMYLTVQQLHIYNTTWAMVLPVAVSAYNLIVCRSFFESGIPVELLEAAKIDGCSDFGFFFKIAIPLSKTIIAVMCLFYATAMWNQFFNALMFLQDDSKMPLQVVLRNLVLMNQSNQMGSSASEMVTKQKLAEQLKYCVVVVSAFPLLCVYPFLQKYLVKRVNIGAVKE